MFHDGTTTNFSLVLYHEACIGDVNELMCVLVNMQWHRFNLHVIIV
jgi:hypothetical protein